MHLKDEQVYKALSASKKFSEKDLAKYQAAAVENKLSLYDYLISNDLADKKTLGEAVAADLGVDYVDLKETPSDSEALKLLPEVQAKNSSAVIFRHDENGAHLAMSDPSDKDFINNFVKRIDKKVHLYFADENDITDALKRYPGSAETGLGSLDELLKMFSEENRGIKKAEDMPIIKIVDKLLELGYVNKSSDIHIEPFETKTIVRFRIDGILHNIAEIPKMYHDLIITRIKILSRLRTDEHRAAQDGRLTFKMEKDKVDIRVSIVPVIYGEKIVMRLLSEKARQYDLENLGFQKKDLLKIQNNIRKPWGMILVTGPTGSGKTTTLYSVIKILNSKEVNISTIEDPVEYDIEGINQIQVNPKTGLTFSKGLRAIVRQDPDIIMVGEIRDEETANIAINSALTGHLVLSTLHTNDAATTLPRLLDMGVKPFLVASTINIAVGQRLVRQICPKCRYKEKVTAENFELFKKLLSPETIKKFKLDDKNLELYRGKGCPECQNTGYKGRLGIFEILEMNEDIKKLIMSHANAGVIRQKAIEQGMTTMLDDGIRKMLDGVTTVEEIMRVTRE